jgi:hypothetical protein
LPLEASTGLVPASAAKRFSHGRHLVTHLLKGRRSLVDYVVEDVAQASLRPPGRRLLDLADVGRAVLDLLEAARGIRLIVRDVAIRSWTGRPFDRPAARRAPAGRWAARNPVRRLLN